MTLVSETLTDPLLGRLVDGRYEVRERVANGGMATVYVAFDKRLEREVALKVMRTSDDAAARELVSRFRREAKAAARLTHPGVVHVYDQGVDHELSYLTMEYVAGENLRERIEHEGTLAVGDALGITDAVLDALASAHRLGVVHRDVKPENVLIDTEGRPRVADFGLARAVTEATGPSTGTIMGTVGYLAPELISHGGADARTDVYAVGVLLFEMVTGRQPFAGDGPLEIAARHVHEDVPAPSTYAPWLPTEFDDVVAELTARDPDERPADAASALALVRSTRARMDDPTLDRRADPPSGATPRLADDATTILDAVPPGATVALPIGIATAFAPVESLHAELIEGDPEAREVAPSRQRGWWWVASIFAVLVLAAASALWWYNAFGPGAFTTMPSVDQKLEQEATDILTGMGFEVKVLHEHDYSVPPGAVIRTDPQAQARVEKGSEVTLFVSLGPPMATVPTVVGEQEAVATAALKEAGFTEFGDTLRTHSDTVPKGEVTASDPAVGEVVRDDTTVTLTVSDGPAPIEFPDVVGMSEDDALDELAPHNLDVTVERERTDDAPKGEVFKQDPKAGAKGNRTDEITIWVSDGPPLITVGDYVGMDVDAAERAAERAGFEVSLYGYWPWSSPNTVVGQSIEPEQQVEKGTTITLRYN